MAASCPGTRSRTALMAGCYPGGTDGIVAILQDAVQSILHTLEHLGGWVVRVDHDEPLRVLLGDLQVGVGHLGVEVLAFQLHPVGALGRSEQPQLGLQVQQDHQVREEPLGGPDVQRQHVLLAEPARPALVGERRVDVAVADHDLPVGERRTDHRRHGLRAGGGEQQRLGPGVQRAGLGIQQDLADVFAQLGPTGLARDQHVQAPASAGTPRPGGSACPCRRPPRPRRR